MGRDNLYGEDGNDVIRADNDQHADDYVDGGAGLDTCYYNRWYMIFPTVSNGDEMINIEIKTLSAT